MKFIAAFLLLCLPSLAAYSNGYTYRRTVTIDNTKVSGTTNLTNYPMLFSGTYTWLKSVANGGEVASSSGATPYDIRFETTGGTQLDHEVEKWDATTGASIIWVEVPSVSYTTPDTVIYIYTNKSGLGSSEENITGVWTDYWAVYHFAGGTSGADSTTQGYTLTLTNTSGTTGGIGDGIQCTATSSPSAISSTYDWTHTGGATYQLWINKPSSNKNNLMQVGDSTPASPRLLFLIFSDDNVYWDYGNNSTGRVSTSYSSYYAAWKMIHLTSSGSSNTSQVMYLNGSSIASQASSISASGFTGLYLCKSGAAATYADGSFDEVRARKTQVTSDWVATEWNNHNSPSTFYSVGSQESSSSPAGLLANQPQVID